MLVMKSPVRIYTIVQQRGQEYSSGWAKLSHRRSYHGFPVNQSWERKSRSTISALSQTLTQVGGYKYIDSTDIRDVSWKMRCLCLSSTSLVLRSKLSCVKSKESNDHEELKSKWTESGLACTSLHLRAEGIPKLHRLSAERGWWVRTGSLDSFWYCAVMIKSWFIHNHDHDWNWK